MFRGLAIESTRELPPGVNSDETARAAEDEAPAEAEAELRPERPTAIAAHRGADEDAELVHAEKLRARNAEDDPLMRFAPRLIP